MIIRNLTLILCSVFITVGCRQVGTKNGQMSDENDSVHQKELVKTELSDVYHRFPSPNEMLMVLDKANLTFNQTLLNSPSKVNDYFESKSQALNLGIYIADFAYLSVFKKYNESTPYFESIYKLCDKLEFSSAFDYNILKRIQDNASNPDSLKAISDLAFNSLNDYLVSNNKEKSFVLISIGGFIEALYLTFGLSDSFTEDNILVQHIADQKYVLDNIVSFAKPYSDDIDIKSTLDLLSPVIEAYNKIEIIPEETKVTKTSDGKLIISGGDKLVLSEELYNKLHLSITNARNQIIK